jgi:hypothetical protein
MRHFRERPSKGDVFMLDFRRLALFLPWIVLSSGSTFAQSSVELLHQQSSSQYQLIKQLMEGLAAKGELDDHIYNAHGKHFDLLYCDKGSMYLMDYNVKEKLLPTMADLAFEVVTLKTSLKKLGYPSELWSSAIDKQESLKLANIEGEAKEYQHDALMKGILLTPTFRRELLHNLNEYRLAHRNLRLATVVTEGGCGAGEVAVKISTRPPGAQVMYISQFQHDLCKAQHLDPDDFKQCDHWQEAHEDLSSDMAGEYVYVAKWSDGAVRHGTISIEAKNNNKVTLTKP